MQKNILEYLEKTAKIVDFYCLMGQYARMYQTPWRRLTYSSGGAVTQHTSCTVYSSGEKNWANNSDIALMSDLDSIMEKLGVATTSQAGLMSAEDKAILDALVASVVTVHSGDVAPVASIGEDGDYYVVV